MKFVATRSVALSAAWLLALGWAAGGASAASSAASLASESVSTSIGSLSDSLRNSSNSSGTPARLAEGDYRIIEVADVVEQPDRLRLTLQSMPEPALAAPADSTASAQLFLILPRQTVEQAGLTAGRVVAAHTRPYGVEFAQGTPAEAFFLLLTDDWYRDLQTRPVAL